MVAFGCCFDVFMIDSFLVSGVNERAEEEVDAFEGVDLLEDFYAGWNGESLVVLNSDLDHNLDVLATVPEKILHALEGDGCLHLGEVVGDPLRVQAVGVEDDSLDILDVTVVFECSLVEPLLFAKLGNTIAVELVPAVHLKDGVSHLGSSNQVHLQGLCLPRTVFRPVEPHALDQESRHLLEPVELEEQLRDPVHVNVRVPLE